MLATRAIYLPPSDNWRLKNENTQKESTSESWRDRRGLKERAQTNKCAKMKESGEIREISRDWRVRKEEKGTRVDEIGEDVTGIYGICMPTEWKLQKMYKRLKVDNNKFTTWLVETIYPCSENLPCNANLPHYITLSPKKSKGRSKPDPAVTLDAVLTTSTDHPKYDIVVNDIPELARLHQKVPQSIMALLDRSIVERVEYSHWMSLKSMDEKSRLADENHRYYIKILKKVKIVLNERLEHETETSFQEHSPSPPKTTSAPTQRHNARLDKRKSSATSLQGPDRTKAAKHSTTTQMQHLQGNWRKLVSDTCEKGVDKSRTPVAKPMSYAGVARVA